MEAVGSNEPCQGHLNFRYTRPCKRPSTTYAKVKWSGARFQISDFRFCDMLLCQLRGLRHNGQACEIQVLIYLCIARKGMRK